MIMLAPYHPGGIFHSTLFVPLILSPGIFLQEKSSRLGHSDLQHVAEVEGEGASRKGAKTQSRGRDSSLLAVAQNDRGCAQAYLALRVILRERRDRRICGEENGEMRDGSLTHPPSHWSCAVTRRRLLTLLRVLDKDAKRILLATFGRLGVDGVQSLVAHRGDVIESLLVDDGCCPCGPVKCPGKVLHESGIGRI